MAHGPQKKTLGFGGNLDNVTLVLGCGYDSMRGERHPATFYRASV